MKTLVIYYSFSGNTKKIALQLADELDTKPFEVKDVKRLSKFKAYTWGCYKALRMQSAPVQPINVNFDEYEKIIILSPVWAGHPAPQIHSVLNLLPSGKEVSFRAVSASGTSGGKDRVLLLLGKKGCKAIDYQDIKA